MELKYLCTPPGAAPAGRWSREGAGASPAPSASPSAGLRPLNKPSQAISLPGRHLSEDREVNAMRPRRQKKHSSGDLKINVKLYNIKSFCRGKKLSALLGPGVWSPPAKPPRNKAREADGGDSHGHSAGLVIWGNFTPVMAFHWHGELLIPHLFLAFAR